MGWAIWVVATLVWLFLWMLLAARYTAGQDDDARVRALGSLLPAFGITSCVFVLLFATSRDPVSWPIILWTHHASFVALFIFLLTAEYLQLEAWWKIRRSNPVGSIAATYRQLWALTEIVPGAVAPVIFLTGLRLIWEKPHSNSPAAVWLLAIIVTFSVLFWDGLVGYSPIVRRWQRFWKRAWQQDLSIEFITSNRSSIGESVQLLAHCLSWPILFLLGLSRFDTPNVLSSAIASVEHHLEFLPSGWPEVTVVLALWILAGVLVVSARTIFSREGPRFALTLPSDS